jgi:hypothetical protein
MNEIPTQRLISLSEKKRVLSIYLTSMKKMLPNNCTYLSLMKRRDGELVVRAVVNKTEYLFSVPQDLQMTEADLNRIHKLLTDKCAPNVKEGN